MGLVPTYGVLWLTGAGLAGKHRYAVLKISLPISILAVAAAFFISNAFWYSLSGRFSAMGVIDFSARVIRYFPPYLDSTMLYLAPALIVAALWQSSQRLSEQ
ncbi:MAG: hypothetical protein ACYCSS_07585 [Sulfuriferula sp.]